MSEEIRTILDYGLASKNEDKILKFLDKLYNINFDNPEEWEKLIFTFFSKEVIIPYVITTSLDEDTDWVVDEIKNIYLSKLVDGGVLFWDSNICYKELITIRESLLVGKQLKKFLPYFFLQNSIIRKMLVKKTDKNDNSFKKFGTSIIPVCCEVTSKTGIMYESLYFICPDNSIIIPKNTWSKEILEKWRIKLKRKLNRPKAKIKKRNPIESRLRHEVFKRDNYKCLECGKGKENSTLHADHIIPVAQGGTDELCNLQTLCQACNLAKSNRKWVGGSDE